MTTNCLKPSRLGKIRAAWGCVQRNLQRFPDQRDRVLPVFIMISGMWRNFRFSSYFFSGKRLTGCLRPRSVCQCHLRRSLSWFFLPNTRRTTSASGTSSNSATSPSRRGRTKRSRPATAFLVAAHRRPASSTGQGAGRSAGRTPAAGAPGVRSPPAGTRPRRSASRLAQTMPAATASPCSQAP